MTAPTGRPGKPAVARREDPREGAPDGRARGAPHGPDHGLGQLRAAREENVCCLVKHKKPSGRGASRLDPCHSRRLSVPAGARRLPPPGPGAGPLLKRMSELISLLDLTTTLGSKLWAGGDPRRGASHRDGRDAGLAGRASSCGSGRRLVPPRAVRGVEGLGVLSPARAVAGRTPARRGEAGFFEPPGGPAFEVLCAGDPRASARWRSSSWGRGRAGAPMPTRRCPSCAAWLPARPRPIENGLIYAELREVNQKPLGKVFQLKNLFDISRELTSSFDEESIRGLLWPRSWATSWCRGRRSTSAAPTGAPTRSRAGRSRGERRHSGRPRRARAARRPERRLCAVSDLPAGPLRDRLAESRLSSSSFP